MKHLKQKIPILALSLVACNNAPITSKPTIDTTEQTKVLRPTTAAKTAKIPSWADSLIDNYIKKSTNILIQQANKSKLSETWILDNIIETDTAKYQVYQVGHDVTEKDGSEPRYIVDQWLYLDTTAKKVYEYHLAEDSLSLWTK